MGKFFNSARQPKNFSVMCTVPCDAGAKNAGFRAELNARSGIGITLVKVTALLAELSNSDRATSHFQLRDI